MNGAPVELVVIIVNYRVPQLTLRCIESLLDDSADMPPFQIHVIDNHSGDDSPRIIGDYLDEKGLRERVLLTPSPINGGYAYGNNIGLRRVLEMAQRPRHVWLLNPDTQVYPGAARHLIEFLDAHPRAGMAGSRLEDADGTGQISAFRFPSPASEFLGAMQVGVLDRLFAERLVPVPLQSQPHCADWLAGASLMMKTALVEDIGLMDEDYFLYFEEVDYCLQARRRGWEIWYVPRSRVHHVVGAATGISDLRKKAPRRPQYWFDSRRRFFLKNYGKGTALLADLAAISGYALWRVRRRIQAKPDLDPPHFLQDLLANSVFLRGASLEH